MTDNVTGFSYVHFNMCKREVGGFYFLKYNSEDENAYFNHRKTR